ncbi:lysozyme [Chachezhania sediminis]|uniref:lysozyme n=1 Tax=Chachezhania sediminis TaxID=2599291 RepID=UPI00131BC569|nr:glycoside hydrolase family protein [Chachezhania sediminis]
MQTSAEGVAFIERHEGVVLTAYRDPVGIWTIGSGLTAASGVVTPKAGMKISKAEAAGLLSRALAVNYAPAVAGVMPGARQHEFDGGVSFHFNTGAIGRASWVRAWIERDWSEVGRRIKLWNKGGGKVLPGLQRRREEEFLLIQFGSYAGKVAQNPPSGCARIVVPVTPDEIAAIREGFTALGYPVGDDTRGVAKEAVLAFQRDHALLADAILGKATLSTLQRMLDARSKVKAAGGSAAVAAPATQAPAIAGDTSAADWLGWAGWIALAVCLCWGLWLAWTYRDAIAAKIAPRAPKLATFLRSF